MRKLFVHIGLLLGLVSHAMAAENLCMEGVCIGDDVEKLPVEWKDVTLDYDDNRFITMELEDRSIDELYYDYNEQLIAEKDVLEQLAPYVIRKQRFDQSVLDTLKQVRAICSSLTLTGEVDQTGTDKLFVTFRAVADAGQRGLLRVVRIEKQLDIMAPHLRPADADKYRIAKKELKRQYPSMEVVRDIDGRVSFDKARSTSALLGFRFFSTVSNPLIFRLIDPANITMIEEDDNASARCQR